MKKINKYITFSLITLLMIFGLILKAPIKAHAFSFGQLIDPACFFACDNDSAKKNKKTAVKQPTISISANPQEVSYNGSSVISWSSSNATSCSASGGSNGWGGTKNTSGTFFTGSLTNTATFYLTCSGKGGSINNFITVNVRNNGNNNDHEGGHNNTYENVSVNITADDTSIDYDDSTRIHWDSDNADYCTPSGGTNDWDDENINTSGSFNTGSLRSDKTFRITCYNNGDSANDSVTVRVDDNNNDNNDNDNNDEAPDVTTRNATDTNTQNATLNGRVDGNGSSVRAWFEYGTNYNLGYSTSRSSYGSQSRNFEKSISGLIPNTRYYFRAVAENSEDISYGSTLSFITTGDFNNPVETQTQPTVVIYADQVNIPFNASTNIRWNTTNVTSCVGSAGSLGWAGAKNTGSGFFSTGLLTQSRTYTITCSNNAGSSTDSVTVNVRSQIITSTVTTPRPVSPVVINSSADWITSTLDNSRPHVGDEINYTLHYENISNAPITNVALRVDLPYGVDYLFANGSNPIVSGQTLVFNLGTIRAGSNGTITIGVRVQNDTPAGTNLNFLATMSYIDSAGSTQSVNADASAQVWTEPVSIRPNTSFTANVFGAGFLPTNLFGWLVLFILVMLLILIAKYVFRSNEVLPVWKKDGVDSHDHH